MPIAKQCRNSLPGHGDFGSPLFRDEKVKIKCVWLFLFILIMSKKAYSISVLLKWRVWTLIVAFIPYCLRSVGRVFSIHAEIRSFYTFPSQSHWNCQLIRCSMVFPRTPLVGSWWRSGLQMCLHKHLRTSSHSWIDVFLSWKLNGLDMTGGVSFSFAIRCPIGDPYQVFTLIFSNRKFGKMSWKMCFYAKKISWKCLVFDTRWCLTHRGESAPQSLGETDMQKQHRNFDEFDLRNCTRSWFACVLVQQLWQDEMILRASVRPETISSQVVVGSVYF